MYTKSTILKENTLSEKNSFFMPYRIPFLPSYLFLNQCLTNIECHSYNDDDTLDQLFTNTFNVSTLLTW